MLAGLVPAQCSVRSGCFHFRTIGPIGEVQGVLQAMRWNPYMFKNIQRDVENVVNEI
jgi:hypothetical protein